MAEKSNSVDGLADCVVKNQALVKQLEALGFKSANPEGMTFKEAIACSQIANAIKGDLKAYRAVMDYSKRESKMPLESFLEGNTELPIERLGK